MSDGSSMLSVAQNGVLEPCCAKCCAVCVPAVTSVGAVLSVRVVPKCIVYREAVITSVRHSPSPPR